MSENIYIREIPQNIAKYGCMETAVTPNHDQACMLRMSCVSSDPASRTAMSALAQKICQRLLQCPPKKEPHYLQRSNLTAQEWEDLRRDCRRKALQKGIPDDEIPAYAAQLLQQRLGEMCLTEMVIEGKSLEAHLAEFRQRFGEVHIRSFIKQTIYD